MGRRKDEHYWDQVTKERDGGLKCKHCGHKFKGGVSRIKAHVDRIPGRGVTLCSTNRDSSSDPQEGANGVNPMEVAEDDLEMVDAVVGGSMDHQTNIESTNLPEGSTPMHAVTRSDGGASGSDAINQLNESLDDLTHEESDIKGQEIQDLTRRVREHKEQKPLVLSNELFGRSSKKNVKKIWELLGDDQVFIIGIHGMGGVGKTCLAAHMESEIKRKETFKYVFWVTVSRDFNILKLQEDIAETIGAKLYGHDERTRAANLSLALETKEKSVLILDNVWRYIDLQRVGIPTKVNGFKLILTSRLEHVYRQMDCPPNNVIRMELLFDNEGLGFFLLKLGHDRIPATIPPKVSRIAESIVEECHGLPLGITVMARTMKGVDSIHWWRHALNKLRSSEMEEEVFKVLKLSYDDLMDACMQNCFLHCALYSGIGRTNLIMKLAENGEINGRRSLQEIVAEGHTILDKLKDYSLLSEYQGLRMNRPIRNMACYILKETHRCMVECDRRLAKIPHIQEWTADLEVVSLDENEIKEIPEGTSPCCPRLSTLILSHNPISSIPECFFAHMKTLAILDLSYNYALTSLPDSLSDLSSLISLVLKDCGGLEYVPPLGGLQALSRLEISNTSVEKVLGLEMLTNLKWLNLSDNSELRLEPGTALSGLTNLQYLDLWCAGSLAVKLEDVQGMTMLECFQGSFHDCENYNNYGKNIEDRGYGPKAYHFLLGDVSSGYDPIAPGDDECQTLDFGDCEECPHWLPRDLAKLCVEDNEHWRSLCGALSSNGPSSLSSIEIRGCTRLESLFCSFGNCSLCTNLQNLESLDLISLEYLTVICKEDAANRILAPSPNGVFSHLKHFNIYGCNKTETLLTPGLFSQLQNLQTITVGYCLSLREIFGVSSSGDDDGAFSITLPKLTKLELFDLPELKTLYKGVIV